MSGAAGHNIFIIVRARPL